MRKSQTIWNYTQLRLTDDDEYMAIKIRMPR